MSHQQYHFEPKKGWMNDPNGLVYFRGRYHAFFQHKPNCVTEGAQPMHWGHAVSDDLVHWEELPIALFPDQPYEDKNGCYSGSAIVKDDVLYVFYTAVSHDLGQTQCVAYSHDGITFEKYAGNPVIPHGPRHQKDFRDPCVMAYNGEYRLIVGSGMDGVGQLQLYRSTDLLAWEYVGVLYDAGPGSKVCECPDFFKLDDTYVLMFSRIGVKERATQFVCGDFDGERFTPHTLSTPEIGPDFYAPQTFEDDKGRRIIIGWLYNWGLPPRPQAVSVGGLTIPREITLHDGRVFTYPVAEAQPLLTQQDELVTVTADSVTLHSPRREQPLRYEGAVDRVDILRDAQSIEIFINGGQDSITHWIGE